MVKHSVYLNRLVFVMKGLFGRTVLASLEASLEPEQSSILKEAKQFYEHLYSNKDEQLSDINLCQELAGFDVQILTKKESDALEGFITLKEAAVTLKSDADDTSVILDGSSTSLNETLNVLSSYAKYSGLKINFDETSVVWIGKKKYSTDTIKTRWKLSWGKSNFKLLGIHFNVELHTLLELNYKEKLSKMKNLIQIWKRRYLIPLVKITVIKSILISLLTHLFISLPNPTNSIIKQLKTMLLDFLWEGPSKIKQNVLVKDYSEGGLKMINIDAFIKGLKATWIRQSFISSGITKEFAILMICSKKMGNSILS